MAKEKTKEKSESKMNNPALKGEVSIDKMLKNKLTNPRLRRSNVVLDGFSSCISYAAKEFSRTPEMSASKMVSQPGMLLHQTKGTVPFEQLKGSADTHSWRQFNKQMDVVNGDMQFIYFASLPVSNLPQEKLTIYPQSIKLEWVFGIFNFPDKMESILSEAVLSGFQIHFLSPKLTRRAHANLNVYFEEPSIRALPNSQTKELNLLEDGDSSPNLKVWVSSPLM